MVGQAGLEPATCGLGIRHSVQLSYWPVNSERQYQKIVCLATIFIFAKL